MESLAPALAYLKQASSGADPATALRAETALEELLTNSVTHGGAGQLVSASVWLGVAVHGEVLRLRYEDACPAFDPLPVIESALQLIQNPAEHRPVGGLGLLMEYGSPFGEMEAAAEFYIGPIVEAHTGPWSFIANLMLVKFMGGKAEPGNDEFVRDEKWDFSYATQLEYEISRNWGVALEAYGTFDRLGDTGSPGENRALFGDLDQHRAGPIAYYTFFPGEGASTRRVHAGAATALSDDVDGQKNEAKELAVAIGTGVLFGLNENTPDLTYKLSVEVEY